ncbi:MAG TPA: GNAT family N-acetyltransferase [Mycobacteriales bacterium]
MPVVTRGGPAEFSARLSELVEVYRSAFLEVHERDPVRAADERRSFMQIHAIRADLVLATVDDDRGLAGFCYGYRGEPGQYWHDAVMRALPAPDADHWFGSCREIAELHVRPDAQGLGLGRALLRAALDGAAERSAALSVLDAADSPARHLYAAEGFAAVLPAFRFPGNSLSYAVMAKVLAPVSP